MVYSHRILSVSGNTVSIGLLQGLQIIINHNVPPPPPRRNFFFKSASAQNSFSAFLLKEAFINIRMELGTEILPKVGL